VRRTALKRRDSRSDRVILLVADTRSNRTVIRAVGVPLVENSLGADAVLAALRRGHDPGGSAVILL
jgi:hypothetical protein